MGLTPPQLHRAGTPRTLTNSFRILACRARALRPEFPMGIRSSSSRITTGRTSSPTHSTKLDIQWQPRKDLAIDIGYVGNLGRHEVIPIPFQSKRSIAAPVQSHFERRRPSSKTVQPTCPAGVSISSELRPTAGRFKVKTGSDGNPYQFNFEGGNVDLRVYPSSGTPQNRSHIRRRGVSAYNALQVHVEKRLSHGLSGWAPPTPIPTRSDEQRPGTLRFTTETMRSTYGRAMATRTLTALT